MRMLLAMAIMLSAAAVAPAAETPEQPRTDPTARPRQLFAHYMGCYPLDKFGDPYPEKIKYDSGNYDHAIGGSYYNPPLMPRGLRLDPVEAAALDIRRAIRAGVDGFAIDVFAGREHAIETTRRLFEAAEKYDLPFQITLCLDAQYRNPAAIQFILEEFGDSPKLARRDGRVMFFGYNTRDAEYFVREYFDRLKAGKQVIPSNYAHDTGYKGLPQRPRDMMDFPELASLDDFWHTDAGLATHIQPFRMYEKLFGRKMFFQYELSPILRGFSGFREYAGMDFFRRAIKRIAGDFDSLGSFLPSTHASAEQIVELAAIARAQGAEWGEALCYQYDNPKWTRVHLGPIGETLLHRWDMIDKTGATLLQFTTWNDYAENTMLAPAHETRYVHSELNAYFAEKWKTGKEPAVVGDRLYAIYHKYPVGAEKDSFPFRAARVLDIEKPLEIIAILEKPGKISLPGRGESWDAPAGFSYRTFPGTPGKVEVALHRDGGLVKELKCAEPITEAVFRPQSTPTCYSTEFMKYWKEDFGDVPPATLRGYYEVSDDSGLPNWFRMVYFGRYGDWDHLPVVDPDADSDGDGVSNIEEYRRRSDPTRPDAPDYEKNFVWEPAKDLPRNYSFNPDWDTRRRGVWHYYATRVEGRPYTLFNDLERRSASEGWTISHQFPWYNRKDYPWGREPRDFSIPQCSITQEWNKDGQQTVLRPNTQHGVALGWTSPVAGEVEVSYTIESGSGGRLQLRAPDGVNILSEVSFQYPGQTERSLRVRVEKGDVLYWVAPENPAGQSVSMKNLKVTKL